MVIVNDRTNRVGSLSNNAVENDFLKMIGQATIAPGKRNNGKISDQKHHIMKRDPSEYDTYKEKLHHGKPPSGIENLLVRNKNNKTNIE